MPGPVAKRPITVHSEDAGSEVVGQDLKFLQQD